MSDRRRHRDDVDDERSRKRPHSASEDEASQKKPSFPSYLDDADLPPKIRLLCEIVAKSPSTSVEAALDSAGVRVSTDDVEYVLKLSYSHPGAAVKFFRWSGSQLQHNHSPYAWNLVVDLLGKNALFEAMWDAVKSMRAERLLSLATFASIFSSYVAARRPEEAIMAFELMDQYSVPRDVAALNSLLSAICRNGQTPRAREFLARVRNSIAPDPDSYAIILEGCENEGDPRGALDAFSEMVDVFGWDPVNVPAYDSFLCAVVRGPGGISEALRHLEILRERRCPPGPKFFRVALEEAVRIKDPDAGEALWKMMGTVGGFRPDAKIYSSMLSLLCYSGQVDSAFDMLDRMVSNAVFPDKDTYNLMLLFMLKGRKLRDAAVVFKEMLRNEHLPTDENCRLAFKVFLDAGDSEMLIKVWRCMMENDLGLLEGCGNALVLKLRDLDMLPEACKYAEDMAEKGIKVNSSTLSKLRNNLVKVGKGNLYDQILRKWKSH